MAGGQEKTASSAKTGGGHAYDGAIAYTDSQFDRLLGDLAEQQVLDNTLLIVTSDHGEQLGEHGLYITASGSTPPAPRAARQAVSRPVAAGVRVPQPVSLRNIARTVLELLAATDDTRFRVLSRDSGAPRMPASRPGGRDGGDTGPFGNETWYPLLKGASSRSSPRAINTSRTETARKSCKFRERVEETVNPVTSPAPRQRWHG